MSIQVSLNATGQRLTDKIVAEPRPREAAPSGKTELDFLLTDETTSRKQENAPVEIDNPLARSLNRKINYHIRQDSHQVVIEVRDGETGEVIRQIPQEEFIRLAERISEYNKNVLDEIA